jgi:hypothetical protein
LILTINEQSLYTFAGLEVSITDPEENVIHVKNAKIVSESQDDERIQVSL